MRGQRGLIMTTALLLLLSLECTLLSTRHRAPGRQKARCDLIIGQARESETASRFSLAWVLNLGCRRNLAARARLLYSMPPRACLLSLLPARSPTKRLHRAVRDVRSKLSIYLPIIILPPVPATPTQGCEECRLQIRETTVLPEPPRLVSSRPVILAPCCLCLPACLSLKMPTTHASTIAS
jgi:hypothetical protein